MGILNLPVREQTCLRLLLWFASQLMLPLRLMPRLMLILLFCMEDMDMVDLDMLVLGMLDLATLLLDTVVLDMLVSDILDLDITARGLLMLNPRPRLTLVSFMEDMDMVVLDMPDLAMLVLDMAMLPQLLMATLPLDILVLAIMARGLLMLNLRPRLMLVFFMEDMAMVVLDMLDSDMLVLDMAMLPLPPMATPLLDMEVLAIMARGLLKEHLSISMKQKLKVISDLHFVIQCPLLEV